MALLKIKKGSDLPLVEDLNKATFLAYEDVEGILVTKRIDLKNMTPLFGVTGDMGESTILAPNQKIFTYEATKVSNVLSASSQLIDTSKFLAGQWSSTGSEGTSLNWIRTSKLTVPTSVKGKSVTVSGADDIAVSAALLHIWNASGTIIYTKMGFTAGGFFTFTVPADADKWAFNVANDTGIGNTPQDNSYVTSFMVNLGSSALPYMPLLAVNPSRIDAGDVNYSLNFKVSPKVPDAIDDLNPINKKMFSQIAKDSPQLIDTSKFVSGQWSSTGSAGTSLNWIRTDKLIVPTSIKGKEITVSGADDIAVSAALLHIWNASGTIIYTKMGFTAGGFFTFTVPADADKWAFNVANDTGIGNTPQDNSYVTSFMVNLGSSALPYMPYGLIIDTSKVMNVSFNENEIIFIKESADIFAIYYHTKGSSNDIWLKLGLIHYVDSIKFINVYRIDQGWIVRRIDNFKFEIIQQVIYNGVWENAIYISGYGYTDAVGGSHGWEIIDSFHVFIDDVNIDLSQSSIRIKGTSFYMISASKFKSPDGASNVAQSTKRWDMPDSYITSAENEALNEAVAYLWQGEQPQYSYRWSLDKIYAKKSWGAISGYLNIGYFIRFSSPQFLPEPVNVRIVAVKEPVNDPQSPEITIANNVTARAVGSVLNEIPSVEQAVDRKDRDVREYAKRRWKDTQELIDNIMGMTDEFKENLLSSLVFEGMVFRAGAASLQFRFLGDDWNTSIEPALYYDKINKQFQCPASKIIHETIKIGGVKPYWTAPAYISDNLTELTTPYYLYLKCSKELSLVSGRLTGVATYFISTEKIKLEDIDGYYTFWVAFINSENEDGDRSFTTMYGLAELLPGQLTVDTIRSSDGGSYWKALKNQFKLGDGDNSMDWNVTEANTLSLTNVVIRDALKVAGSALIAGFNFYNDRIESVKTVTFNSVTYPALKIIGNSTEAVIELRSIVEKYTENQGFTNVMQTLKFDSNTGEITSITSDNDICSLNSQGLYANRAGTNAFPASTGVQLKAAITGSGNGKMDKSAWGNNWGVVGVLGIAENTSSNPAPAYGGWFENLKVNGLVLETNIISGSEASVTLMSKQTMTLSFATSQVVVNLPLKADRGTTLFIKQINSGYLRLYPNTGQVVIDDSSPQSYFDVGEGWMAICVFVDGISGKTGNVDAWVLSKFRF